MKIETYEIEEIKNSELSTMAADSEAIELIEKLGLAGQKQLLNPETASRFPYPALTKLQELVFTCLFPQKTTLHEFGNEIIPLRVLQVAAYCRDFKQTFWLEVWHSAIAKQDPILIGRSGQWSGQQYLLARWGDALLTFEELVIKARPIYEGQCKAKLQKIRSAVITKEAELPAEIEQALLTGEAPSFYFNA